MHGHKKSKLTQNIIHVNYYVQKSGYKNRPPLLVGPVEANGVFAAFKVRLLDRLVRLGDPDLLVGPSNTALDGVANVHVHLEVRMPKNYGNIVRIACC